MKQKYIYSKISLFTSLFIVSTLSACVHTTKLLRSGPATPEKKDNTCWIEKNNAVSWVGRLLMVQLPHLASLSSPDSLRSEWPKIRNANFNNPTFDDIKATSDTRKVDQPSKFRLYRTL